MPDSAKPQRRKQPMPVSGAVPRLCGIAGADGWAFQGALTKSVKQHGHDRRRCLLTEAATRTARRSLGVVWQLELAAVGTLTQAATPCARCVALCDAPGRCWTTHARFNPHTFLHGTWL